MYNYQEIAVKKHGSLAGIERTKAERLADKYERLSKVRAGGAAGKHQE